MDSRIQKLADTIVNYSCAVQSGAKVTIDVIGDSPKALVKALITKMYEAGAIPHVIEKDASIIREQLIGLTEETAKNWAKHDLHRLKDTDVYIMIKALNNQSELSDIPQEKMVLYGEHYTKEINAYIVNNTRWISLRYPNSSMAQLANMSLEAFEDYYFVVCNLDYSKLLKAMDYLVSLMDKTDKVRICGEGTDISFSIKGIPVHKCAGLINLPDGEVYTAPIRNSVNGAVQFNTPSIYQGICYEQIKLEFEDGKIIKATSNKMEQMNTVLNTDEGSRYIGEFALGVNPYIMKPMKDILFDEKIGGSFHLTPGFSYENAFNGNRSSIHWDLVCIQTKEYGGGEIYFDGVLIRKDGVFIPRELHDLNKK